MLLFAFLGCHHGREVAAAAVQTLFCDEPTVPQPGCRPVSACAGVVGGVMMYWYQSGSDAWVCESRDNCDAAGMATVISICAGAADPEEF